MSSKRQFRYTIKPGISSPITLNTLPRAICSLHQDGKPTPALKLYADEDGMVRFYLNPNTPSGVTLNLVLDCEVGRKVTQYPLELRVSSIMTQEMPAPPYESPKPGRKAASIRPALSQRDMLTFSYKELVKLGYPPRPDPKDARSFNQWRRMVSVPVTMIKPHLVPRPKISDGLARIVYAPENTIQVSSSNWCGMVLLGGGPFVLSSGTWNVPTGGTGLFRSASSLWTGLGGYNSQPLVQAGTEYDTTLISPPNLWAYVYYAWIEIWPQEPSQMISNFDVHRGDQIVVNVWLGDDNGFNPWGPLCWFNVHNYSTSQAVQFFTARTDTTTMVGTTAEWVMERPSFNGNTYDLTPFDSTMVYAPFARTSSPPNAAVYYLDNTNVRVTMVDQNTGDTLAEVTPMDDNSMRFDWRALH